VRAASPTQESKDEGSSCLLHLGIYSAIEILNSHAFPVSTHSINPAFSIIPLCESALDAVIDHYQYLVLSEIAGLTYKPPCLLKEDLTQEGLILLIKSARTFSPTKSHNRTFPPYARTCIHNGLIDIAKWAWRDNTRLMSALTAGNILSVDTNGTVHPAFLLSRGVNYDPAEAALLEDEALFVRSVMKELSPRHQAVLQLSQIDGWSLRQIGDYLQLSRTRIHQILQEGIIFMRKRYVEERMS